MTTTAHWPMLTLTCERCDTRTGDTSVKDGHYRSLQRFPSELLTGRRHHGTVYVVDMENPMTTKNTNRRRLRWTIRRPNRDCSDCTDYRSTDGSNRVLLTVCCAKCHGQARR